MEASMSWKQIPSLVSLCLDTVKQQIIRACLESTEDIDRDFYGIPPHLFDDLALRLPPFALEKLQTDIPYKESEEYGAPTGGCDHNGKKRGRLWYGQFYLVWREICKTRMTVSADDPLISDWRGLFWQMHLQNCLDEAAELAMLPAFAGSILEMKVSDRMLEWIAGGEKLKDSNYSNLSFHFQQFGHHASHLRLQNVFCVPEICQLLIRSKLHSLQLQWIRSEEHVDGLCKLLIQNRETLLSISFSHCSLSSRHVDKICRSVNLVKSEGHAVDTHGIRVFSLNCSFFLEDNLVSLPAGFTSFLSSGRSLYSLQLRHSHLDGSFAKLLFGILLDASSSLSLLDLSYNMIAGWLSNFDWRSLSTLPSPLRTGKSLKSLRSLNIKANNIQKGDMRNLRYALACMPKLETLDLSENPIGDDGVRSLIPYFINASEGCSTLSELKLEDCELSCDGVSLLLDKLSALKTPLHTLSLSNNTLGSQVAGALGRFLGTSIKELNIHNIGLGSAGFEKLLETMAEESNLVTITLSSNRGGIECAKFLSKLISLAPELFRVDASYNIMPVESLKIICSVLKGAQGKLEELKLHGNNWEFEPSHALLLSEFQCNGKPILHLPTSRPPRTFHDHDP